VPCFSGTKKNLLSFWEETRTVNGGKQVVVSEQLHRGFGGKKTQKELKGRAGALGTAKPANWETSKTKKKAGIPSRGA